MKHVSIFSFIIVTNKYFSSPSPSNVNVKIVNKEWWIDELFTIAEAVNKEWWIDEFSYVNY